MNLNMYLAESGAVIKAYISGGEQNTDLYLADSTRMKSSIKTGVYGTKILQSFYYADEWTESIIPYCKSFMLDSGAFTFFTAGKAVNWEDYIRRYAQFITKNNVKLFFELDIDSLIGYKKVLEYRAMLESLTGRRCIPVWHKSRGKAEFIKMCKEYDYVAIGGIVSKEFSKEEHKYFPWFIETAHKHGAKIHGLGYTNLQGLTKYHFDSVDSSSWTAGNRFGHVYQFDGKTIVQHKSGSGRRLSDTGEVARINFDAWAKFSEYAETHL